ncbi:globoside alpha-1,3-N-acetylgalactosaminyltransferase 1-like isoform X2 [Megalops cyprinoides]|uniref:globoside alpha-1,3-N-acetylgalactosaminyltransferase 1-like isoform X2 n=1 Tax=Megalops cyprinoides TaxID=118141 RepID=UPI001865239E|nr:globoside alpha-1,3-N-acetylgalactosaminyltransferase 1-like isoform X2 [Megalops cyprinoides]XP_036408463.1 globoside alpha-1,3-N-acetylgalactosaminyltransferase 1-like isoform X2 [Megalops cyprinoides]
MLRSFCSQSITQSIPALPATPRDVLQPKRANYGQPLALIPQRNDVLTVTPWLAPIVWERTFDPDMIDSAYKSLNITIATTVFAVGKYTQFLQDFLETAEKYYMSGLRVHYYVFTDQPREVPRVELAAGRKISIIQVPKYSRWQEISLRRMEIIERHINETIHREADYIFCMDVDMKFHDRWGPETLGTLVGVLHPWFYEFTRDKFTYERRPESTAYIPMEEGDFYYMAAVFGGRVKEVHALTKKCHEHLDKDKSKNLEAIWQEESHLNWYFLHNKPTKVLSPEYLWDDQKGGLPSEIKRKRFSAVIKNKEAVRENV